MTTTEEIPDLDEDLDPLDPADADLSDEEKAAKAAADKAAEDSLGDAGKKALDAMKAKWQKERDLRKAADAKLAEATKPKPKDDDKPDVDSIRAEVEKAATAKVNERIIRSEIRAAAAGKLQDPKDALAHLDLKQFEVDDDGNVDEDEIADAIADLLKRKPYLGVTQGDGKRFKGTADAGVQGKAGKPQLTEADVKQLAAQGKHAEIEKARLDGRLNTLLGITT
jgi:hypothetical protein